jgi:hypothetical protein
LGGSFLCHEAGDIEAILLGLFDHLALAQRVAIPADSNELPAACQSGLLGIDADPLESPPFQPPMILAPIRIIFRGKKTLGAA